MVSYAPNTQSYNFTHMYDFQDLRAKKQPEMCITPGTLYDFIAKNNFTKIKLIIDRAKMSGQMMDPQADCTLIIPTDDFLSDIPDEYFSRMDDGLARQLLDSCTLNRKIEGKLLRSSPVCYYFTRKPEMRMYVTNISSKTKVNNCVNVVSFDNMTSNGIIHVVDGLITPNYDHFLN